MSFSPRPRRPFRRAVAVSMMALTILAAGGPGPACALSTDDILVEVLGELLRETLRDSRNRKKSPAPEEDKNGGRTASKGKDAKDEAAPEAIHWRVYQKIDELGTSLSGLAGRIVARNKPALDAKDRVWAKDKTIVAAHPSPGKSGFVEDFISTIDPLLTFAGGVRVGTTAKELEEFLGAPLDEISARPGLINLSPDPRRYVRIFYDEGKNGGKVTRLDWLCTDVTRSEEAEDFMEESMKRMGFPELPDELDR